MTSPYQLPVWPLDPIPLDLSSYAVHSAGWWRIVTRETLRAR